MGINFPSFPTVGQIHQGYTWDGVKWVGPEVIEKLPLTGGTITGSLTVDENLTVTNGELTIPLKMTIGSGASIFGSMAGGFVGPESMTAQWSLKTSGGIEGGFLAWTDGFYMGAWGNHKLCIRANNTDRITVTPGGDITTDGGNVRFNGDIRAVRPAAPTTGVFYGGTTDSYVFYNGTNWALQSAASGNPTTNGNVIWHAGNLSSPWHSGNLTPSSYVWKGGDTMTGRLITTPSAGYISDAAASQGAIEVVGTNGHGAKIAFHHPSSFAAYFGLDHDNQWAVGGWSYGGARYRIWHEANFNPASYLPLSGGTVTGTLYVNAELKTSGTIIRLTADGSRYLWWDGTNYILGGSGTAWHTGNFTPGSYLPLSGGTLSGYLYSYAIENTHHIAVGINGAAASCYLYFGPTGWNRYLRFDAGDTFYLNGHFNCSNVTSTYLLSSGYVQAASGLRSNTILGDSQPWFNKGIEFSVNAGFELQGIHYSGNWFGPRFGVNGYSYDFRHDGNAFKSGGGDWSNNSDVRIKNILGDYTSGLDAIVALRPVWYRFKGNDTWGPPDLYPVGKIKTEEEAARKEAPAVPYANSDHLTDATDKKEYIGLIAQEAEVSMPEMVTKNKGYIDGVEVSDMRTIDTTPLVFALINATKEMKALVESLTKRIEALEAR